MADQDDRVYVGTISYLLSDRNYLDFIRDGLNVNQLPLLADAVASIQRSLDEFPTINLRHRGGSIAQRRGAPEFIQKYSDFEPFGFQLHDVAVEAVSLESGSVYAKLRIVAAVSFVAYQGLADYKDVKEGFAELRSDVIGAVNQAFGVAGAGPVEVPGQEEDASIRYYFVQPRRLEEEVLRRRIQQPGA